MRPRRIWILTSSEDYHDSGYLILVSYDLRVPGSRERLQREHRRWRVEAAIEILDSDHAVLIIRPGTARKLGF
jgi:hypothetical protein